MEWNVDIEMEVTSVKTFKVSAESRSEAIKVALNAAISAEWEEPKSQGFHLVHIDVA